MTATLQRVAVWFWAKWSKAMPELPDVEIIKKRVDAGALRREIASVDVQAGKMLREIGAGKLHDVLRGHKLTKTRRHGKHLFIGTEDGRWLELHFGMSGDIALYQSNDNRPDFDAVDITFTDGEHLGIISRRKLGHLAVIKDPESYIEGQKLGPDALGVDQTLFSERLRSKHGKVKSVLMNQSVLAGIGNVYADEILFQARLHPETKMGALTDRQIAALYDAMRDVLETAIEKQADPKQMPEKWLLPKRKKGARCPNCTGEICKISVASRSTYFCPDCQEK